MAWLLAEEPAANVRELLVAPQNVAASDLTLIECERALHGAVALGELSEAEATDRRALLATAAAHWAIRRIGPEQFEGARQSFPGQRVQTLDAMHLASLPVARSTVSGLALLGLDIRVRAAAAGLGIQLRPE